MSIGVSGLMFAHISSIIAAASSLSGPKFRSDSVFSSYFKLPAPTKTPSPYLVPLVRVRAPATMVIELSKIIR